MTTPFLPGNRLTEERLNTGQMIGRLVLQLHQTVAQSISQQTTTPVVADALVWDTADLDLLGGWNSGVNPSRYTPTAAGWYELSGAVGYASSSGGTRRGGAWWLNGSLLASGRTVVVTNSTVVSAQPTIPMRTVSVLLNGTTDYVELGGWQSSGGALNTATTASLRSSVGIKYVGPP
jgi:hypothetical protein